MTDTISNLIGEIAEQVAENNLAEITYEKGDVKIKVVGQQNQSTTKTETVETEDIHPQVDSANEIIIKSPMVGVVYLKPQPDKDPYVKVGQEVMAEQTLCIIEAMKTFNPIVSTSNGRVSKILVKDNSPVEYGSPLFSITYGE